MKHCNTISSFDKEAWFQVQLSDASLQNKEGRFLVASALSEQMKK